MFKVGDKVKIIYNDKNSLDLRIGTVHTIEKIDLNDPYPYALSGKQSNWSEKEIELIKGVTTVSKYYRTIKDTPAWLKGAILVQGDKEDRDYKAISDLWDTFEKDYPKDYFESFKIIENNPEWFERVYDVKILGKVRYMTKEAARKIHDELYKEKK